MPRPYRLGQRQAASAQTRARILAAAHELLTAPDDFSGFSVDAVARQADVARMTVYYQFGSKVGLLEALSDDLAARGGMEQLAAAFRLPDPLDALAAFIAIFVRFWTADRLATRRLRALAALDADFEQVIRARDERRREGLRVLVGRIATHPDGSLHRPVEDAVDLLHTLTSFESFDTLAGDGRSADDVTLLLQGLARDVLTLHDD
jgi:AcrR family transcriptional regulator